MRYLRIWSDARGESHLAEVEVTFEKNEGDARGVPPVGLSSTQDVASAYYLRLPAGWLGDFHPSPARQFVIQLQGRLEVTMSSGSVVATGPGTIWLVEDTVGKGHRTRVVGKEDSVAFVVTAPA